MNKTTVLAIALGVLSALSGESRASDKPVAPIKSESSFKSSAPTKVTKPTAALRLARYWGKQHGLSTSEIEEQATAIEESKARTSGPSHEGHVVADRFNFKYKALGIPTGSKRNAIIIRSNQPAPENLVELALAAKKVGIAPSEVAILNLRAENNVEGTYIRSYAKSEYADEKMVGQFRTENMRILDHTIPRRDQVVKMLSMLTDPNIKLVVIHCKAGRARTGIMVALQRIVLDGWSVDDALAEAADKGLRRPLQKAFVEHFAADWKAGKIQLATRSTKAQEI